MGLAALASVAVPLALLWAGLALWLGRTQQRMAASSEPARAVQDAPRHDPRGQVR
jgi:AAA family ATP:ADP antiporter